MSASLLREAAALMRKRAERVKSSGYGFSSKWTTPTTMLTRLTSGDRIVAESRDVDSLYDLDHMSYWHPAVALAVADWMEKTAEHMDPELALDGGCLDCEEDGALVVARAYLGRAAS